MLEKIRRKYQSGVLISIFALAPAYLPADTSHPKAMVGTTMMSKPFA